ncbi:hypothetical protein [Embleya sp. NPDC059237]|uniref:hypothetical protein n=1 Tax=Embleya sp. NPDC059237 TaxID=3346784 RepID=UPI0036908796
MGRIHLGPGTDGGLVAIKTLLADGEVGAVNRRRFAREVKIARQVRAEHTARVIERGVPAADIHYEVFGPDLWLGGQ